MAPDGTIDSTGIGARQSANEGAVDPIDRVFRKLRGQTLVRRIVLGRDQHTRGPTIEPMDDTWP